MYDVEYISEEDLEFERKYAISNFLKEIAGYYDGNTRQTLHAWAIRYIHGEFLLPLP